MTRRFELSAIEARTMDIDTPWEREYWAKHFHVSEYEIVRIVRTVGPYSDAVASYIQAKSADATSAQLAVKG
jgi:hypothetical protein